MSSALHRRSAANGFLQEMFHPRVRSNNKEIRCFLQGQCDSVDKGFWGHPVPPAPALSCWLMHAET